MGVLMRTITMSPNRRLTLPAEVRQRLSLTGEAAFDVEVTEHNGVTLWPVGLVPREDAWASTAEHLAQEAKARRRARGTRTPGLRC
jgi:bifunctional DNA-binding transcriptional regulator/antitoxin component of YhaV-PrlF toxin-antitoxin module